MANFSPNIRFSRASRNLPRSRCRKRPNWPCHRRMSRSWVWVTKLQNGPWHFRGMNTWQFFHGIFNRISIDDLDFLVIFLDYLVIFHGIFVCFLQLGKSTAGKANAINPQGFMKSQGMMAIWKMVGWRHSKITSNCGDPQNTNFGRLKIRSATNQRIIQLETQITIWLFNIAMENHHV